jgi:phosphate transport system protein
MAQSHTYKSFDQDIEELRQEILCMGEHVARAVDDAVNALLTHDVALAGEVERGDEAVNALYAQAGRLVMRALTRQHPVAQDLRQIMATEHIAIDLERIGDHAKAIARAVSELKQPVGAQAGSQLRWLRSRTLSSLQQVLGAYGEWQQERLANVLSNDQEVDRLYRRLFADLLAEMKDGSVGIEDGSQLLFVAKSLERVGDHARNIASDVQIALNGTGAHRRS